MNKNNIKTAVDEQRGLESPTETELKQDFGKRAFSPTLPPGGAGGRSSGADVATVAAVIYRRRVGAGGRGSL